jgi:hypothetical protein
MMLDVLFKIKDEQDPGLVFRRSCRHARALTLPRTRPKAKSAHARTALHAPLGAPRACFPHFASATH